MMVTRCHGPKPSTFCSHVSVLRPHTCPCDTSWDLTPVLGQPSRLIVLALVTNTSTGDTEMVRIVDACWSGALKLLNYETAFKPIDTDRKGKAQGQLVVDYEFVDCDPIPVPPPPPPPGLSDYNVTAY
ncbi:hypothetical protein PTKIN_Ptkin01aG0341500 [Pterospermum kingtungense]